MWSLCAARIPRPINNVHLYMYVCMSIVYAHTSVCDAAKRSDRNHLHFYDDFFWRDAAKTRTTIIQNNNTIHSNSDNVYYSRDVIIIYTYANELQRSAGFLIFPRCTRSPVIVIIIIITVRNNIIAYDRCYIIIN